MPANGFNPWALHARDNNQTWENPRHPLATLALLHEALFLQRFAAEAEVAVEPEAEVAAWSDFWGDGHPVVLEGTRP